MLPTQDAQLVQRRHHGDPTADRDRALLNLDLRPASAKLLRPRQPVAVVIAVVMEGAAVVRRGQGADRPVAFRPRGSVVGFEKSGLRAFVLRGRVVVDVGDGERGWEGGVGR